MNSFKWILSFQFRSSATILNNKNLCYPNSEQRPGWLLRFWKSFTKLICVDNFFSHNKGDRTKVENKSLNMTQRITKKNHVLLTRYQILLYQITQQVTTWYSLIIPNNLVDMTHITIKGTWPPWGMIQSWVD